MEDIKDGKEEVLDEVVMEHIKQRVRDKVVMEHIKQEVLDELVMEHIKQREAVEKVTQMVAERHSHGGDREVGQGRGEVGRALCFCYVKDSAEVTKEVVVMVVMKDATQEREVVDKVTKMAAELIFSVDAHISLTHSGGKPYECDQCKYSSKTAQNLKTHKLTHSGEKPCACDQCKYSSKTAQNLKTHKLTHSGEKPYACDQYKYSSALAQALKRHKLMLGGKRHCHSDISLKVMYDEYSAEQIFEKDQIHFRTKNGSEAYMKMVMKGLQSFAEVREKLLAVQE